MRAVNRIEKSIVVEFFPRRVCDAIDAHQNKHSPADNSACELILLPLLNLHLNRQVALDRRALGDELAIKSFELLEVHVDMQGVDCVLDGNRLWFGEVDQKHHVFLACVSELPVDNLDVLMCANE